MLTISKPLNAAQAQTYHAKEFTSPDQNYWQKGDVNLGKWQGKMAESFGLSGHVDAEHCARLSQGQHPLTGEQLVKHKPSKEYATEDGKTVKPVEHRAGWDATFSAPKSVSLTALVGGDERVRVAHREAVTAALVGLERYTQARIGGNNAAERTGKFLAAYVCGRDLLRTRSLIEPFTRKRVRYRDTYAMANDYAFGSERAKWVASQWEVLTASAFAVLATGLTLSIYIAGAPSTGAAVITAFLFPGLLASAAVAGNAHAFSLWVAAAMNGALYFGLSWAACKMWMKIRRRISA